jgi:alkaline phosphatase D
VHYGELRWGGIGFAILEDRKWKSAPKSFLPAARIQNGWPQNLQWDSAKEGDVSGAQLLGERQEQFLRKWATSWPEGIEMKAVVSATIFCNLATLPKDAMGDAITPKLPIEPKGGYASDEKLTQDHDSNGWPQTPRNRALRSMRTCLAVHIAGDQHLASTLQYGIEGYNDAAYAICSPAISNIFPRRWYPG